MLRAVSMHTCLLAFLALCVTACPKTTTPLQPHTRPDRHPLPQKTRDTTLPIPPDKNSTKSSRRRVLRDYVRARRWALKKKYDKAAQILFNLLQSGERLGRYELRIRYRLASMYFHLKLPAMAISQLMVLLRKVDSRIPKGSRLGRYSLRGLLTITEHYQDETLIVTLLRRLRSLLYITPQNATVEKLLQPGPKDTKRRWWSAFREHLAYILGRSFFMRGPLYFKQANSFFQQVSPKAPRHRYLKGLYIQAVTRSWVGKLKASSQLFRKILQFPCPPKDPHTPSCATIKTYATLGLARNHYAEAWLALVKYNRLGQAKLRKHSQTMFQKALTIYTQIPKKHGKPIADVAFETAYTHLMLRQYKKALQWVTLLKSPLYQRVFLPEAPILEALIEMKHCHPKRSIQIAKQFVQQYEPLYKRMRRLISHRKTRRWQAEYAVYLRKQMERLQRNQQPELPASILHTLANEKPFREYKALIRAVKQEEKIIQRPMHPLALTPMDSHIRRSLANIRNSLHRLLGASVYFPLRELSRDVGRQLQQAHIIQLEVLQQMKQGRCQQAMTPALLPNRVIASCHVGSILLCSHRSFK